MEDYSKLSGKKLVASFSPYTLDFKRPGGTSRGVLRQKDTWFIKVWEEGSSHIVGIGEAGMFRGLSIDDRPEFETVLARVCENVNEYETYLDGILEEFPAIQFGLETALLDLMAGGKRIFYGPEWTSGKQGILINGLIWMGEEDFLIEQISQKLEAGFTCLKLKIGTLPFEQEITLLRNLRAQFPPEKLELRVDANGAYNYEEAVKVLTALKELSVHSIEQPIPAGQWTSMGKLLKLNLIPIAFDEELIPLCFFDSRTDLLNLIRPDYLILKPSLLGGFAGTRHWIKLAEERGIKWWITSALESNIGLNAIAQFTQELFDEDPKRIMPQGLGTGELFSNNIQSPLELRGEALFYNHRKLWTRKLP